MSNYGLRYKPYFKDISGKTFNKLKAVKFVKREIIEYKNTTGYKYFWKFKCECGGTITTTSQNVLSGRTRSCGCLNNQDKVKHRMCSTRFYQIYTSLKKRCENTNCKSYKNYGGRGIRCEWKSFLEFRDDMFQSYLQHCKLFGEKQTTIERMDNDGNYCPSNCKWATIKEQGLNKRTNHFITWNNRTYTVSQFLKQYHISKSNYYHNYKKLPIPILISKYSRQTPRTQLPV